MVVVLASAMRGFPFPPLTSEPWLFQFASSNRALRYAFLIPFYGSVASLCLLWIKALRASRRRELTSRQVVALFLIWALPLFAGVPLFSGDVYVYYVDGEAMARGYSLYDSGVSALGPEPMVFMVHPIWRDTMTMYGPVFMKITEVVAMLSSGSPILGVTIFRLISLASVAAIGGGVWSLCRRFGRPVSEALVFALLNPLTLLHLVSGAHNDVTMIAFLIGGLAVGLHSRNWVWRFAAILLCTAGAAIKVPAFAAVIVMGWMWAGRGASFWKRSAFAAVTSICGVALLHLLGVVTGLGWGWLKATDVPGIAHPLLSPANAIALSFGSLFGVGFEVNAVTRVLASGVAVFLCVWLVLRTGRRASDEALTRALAWAMVGLGWLGPAVYPWYLTWGIILIGALGIGVLQRHLAWTTIIVAFAVSPGGYGWLDLYTDWKRTTLAFLVVLAMGLATRSVCAKKRFALRVGRGSLDHLGKSVKKGISQWTSSDG